MKIFLFYEPAAAQGVGVGRLLNWNVSHRVGYETAVLSPEATSEARSPGDMKRARRAARPQARCRARCASEYK
jgi:hypothetical protein